MTQKDNTAPRPDAAAAGNAAGGPGAAAQGGGPKPVPGPGGGQGPAQNKGGGQPNPRPAQNKGAGAAAQGGGPKPVPGPGGGQKPAQNNQNQNAQNAQNKGGGPNNPAPAQKPAQNPAQNKGPGGQPGPGKPQGQPQGQPQGKPQGNPQGQGPQGGGQKPGPQPGPQPAPVVEIRPLAEPATMKRRHWGLALGFVLMVLMPLAVAAFYLYGVANDQYASTTGFTVRQEEGGSATDLLGGLAQFAGGGGSSDTDILYEFIQSQEIIEKINARVDLRAHYSQHWPDDPVFSIWPDATIEDMQWFWERIVRISYDKSTGLIELRVLSFDPDFAQAIAEAIVEESQAMINQLNAAARNDLMRYAQSDLDDSVARLKTAREAMTEFRTRTQIVDPSADIQGQMGVVNNLQQQLAEALIELDLLLGSINANDPRITQAERRIEVIRERIARERESFAVDEVAGIGADYPTLMAEYENLSVDREFAEETYRAALAALDIARDTASRQSRYLAAYIRPTLAQSAEFPQRAILLALGALFLIVAWAIVALIYYSIRDRR